MQASVGDLQQQNKSLTDKLNKAEVEVRCYVVHNVVLWCDYVNVYCQLLYSSYCNEKHFRIEETAVSVK